MAEEEGAIHYRIEISTEETRSLKEARNALSDIEKKIYNIKSTRSGRELFENPELFDFGAPIRRGEDRGPIFRGEEEPELPTPARGKRGKGAFERQDAFKNLSGRMENLENDNDYFKQILTGGLLVAGNPTGAVGGFFKSQLGKLLPFIGETLLALGIVETWLDRLLEPGRILDRRFKRIISQEEAGMVSREKKAEIRQGTVDIRMSSWVGNKGITTGQVGSTLQRYRRANLYAQSPLERLEKGVE